MNEREILQNLQDNPFCCKIFATLQDEQNLYFVLEHLAGGELIRQIKKKVCMSLEDTQFYVAEVILAIESLHSSGIIFRDLKPENVLLDAEGHVKLIDFGFSKQMTEIAKDRTFTRCGTPGYCAPEMMMPSIGHTYKADIWSIGILICEMLGGFTPFTNDDVATILE